MFKKLHSNRDPQVTVYSELKKEFGVYFGKAGNCFKGIIDHNPKFLYAAMVVLLLSSIGLSFTIFRHNDPVAKVNPQPSKPVPTINDGFDRILETGAALKQAIALKKMVDSITHKNMLTKQDSTELENALDKLQQINNHFKNTK